MDGKMLTPDRMPFYRDVVPVVLPSLRDLCLQKSQDYDSPLRRLDAKSEAYNQLPADLQQECLLLQRDLNWPLISAHELWGRLTKEQILGGFVVCCSRSCSSYGVALVRRFLKRVIIPTDYLAQGCRCAAREGNAPVCKFLVCEKGVSPYVAAAAAIEWGRQKLIDFFWPHVEDGLERWKSKGTMSKHIRDLVHAVIIGGRADLMRILLEYDVADVVAPFAFRQAGREGHIEVVDVYTRSMQCRTDAWDEFFIGAATTGRTETMEQTLLLMHLRRVRLAKKSLRRAMTEFVCEMVVSRATAIRGIELMMREGAAGLTVFRKVARMGLTELMARAYDTIDPAADEYTGVTRRLSGCHIVLERKSVADMQFLIVMSADRLGSADVNMVTYTLEKGGASAEAKRDGLLCAAVMQGSAIVKHLLESGLYDDRILEGAKKAGNVENVILIANWLGRTEEEIDQLRDVANRNWLPDYDDDWLQK